MLKFFSKTVRVNEMGGKFYAEVKRKAFEFSEVRDQPALIDDVEVKVFDTVEDLNKYFDHVVN